mmetsp:Transcript_98096/g.316337  ORF Transcript_98096/g.316337 Transcript_98096/m.316337 type:complete len:250 (+) Transcript_98096:157-906(+)
MSNHMWPHVNIQTVINTAEARLMPSPVSAMSFMVIRFVAKTIALGGVATGSMKAQLAARVAGTMKVAGMTPSEQESSPMMGRSTLAVAVLLVTSVRKVTINTMSKTTRNGGKLPRMTSWLPSQVERLVALKAVARAKPPPKSNRMCHGVLRSVGQSMRYSVSPLSFFAGMRNKQMAAMMETVSSSNLPLSSPKACTKGFRIIQNSTVKKKTAPTRHSAWLIGPNLRCRASRAGWSEGRSLNDTWKEKTK